jgi:tetratricopeptide (TPR) repeat protein
LRPQSPGTRVAVAEAERAIAHRKAPRNLTAFDYYLLGLEAKHSLTKEGFLRAEELFHKALELDPQLARAHVGLVQAYALMIDAGFTTSVAETLDKQMVSAQKAVASDPKDGETHLALAIAHAYRGEWEKATAEFRQAEELSPNDADLLVICAWNLPALGYPEHAVELAGRALQLNPRYPDWYVLALRLVYFFAENFDKSLEYAKQVKTPFALDYAFIAIAEAYLGDAAAAKSASSNVLRLDPDWSAEGWIRAQGGFARDKESDLFANGAQRAGLPMCVTDIKLNQQPNMPRLKICDEQRTSNTTK